MSDKNKYDKWIATAVTFVSALVILLFLFGCGMHYDKDMLAQSATPEIMPIEDEELFVEPELIQDLGEPDAVTHDEPAPAIKGEPEPAKEENTKQVIPGKNEKTAPKVEKPVTQTKESPVKAVEPPKENEDKKTVTSKIANKFPGTNGSKTGSTSGGGAGGTGSGVSGTVSGRTFKGCPMPSVELQNKVVVEVRVTINAEGRVTSATARSKQGKASSAILRACEQSARSARWSADADTPTAKGTLTFTIVPK